jgi:Kef-type K+ transport system membrane component KefB/nucleotide-binding universal stress UspA family protein
VHEIFAEPVGIFLIIIAVVLVTPLLSERVRLPGIVGIILGGMLIGEHGFQLLHEGSEIEFLAAIGLLYLMFTAGMEVDLEQFNRVKGRAAVFGAITFLCPQLLGMLLGWALGMSWLGAVLLGSAFASHTLIAFPILSRLGMTRNEAVSITVGATVLTDIAAFVVLAVVLGVQDGDLRVGYFVRLLLLLALFTLLLLWGLPRLGKIFFRRFSGRAIEFQFILLALFLAAVVAVQIGVHEVVGAFLAGLAVNAILPQKSPVASHVLFLGESFFIPVFLLYSGMITDPLAFLMDIQTVYIAIGVTAVAYVSKFAASWLAAKLYKYTREEFFTVFGLSHAQAAVTIPTLLVGVETGLFSDRLFNAAILMILLTTITSSLITEHHGKHLKISAEERKDYPFFSRMLVPIANPQTQEHLVTLANILARTNSGKLLALYIARNMHGQIFGLEQQEQLLGRVTDLLDDPNADVDLLFRIETSIANGIVHAAIEQQATAIVMGWRGKPAFRQRVFGTILDEVVWGAQVPVMVGRFNTPINGVRRLVLVLLPGSLPTGSVSRTLDVLEAMADAVNVPSLILADGQYRERVRAYYARKGLDDTPVEVAPLGRNALQSIASQVDNQDMLIIPTLGSRNRYLGSLKRLPEELASRIPGNTLIIHYPH